MWVSRPRSRPVVFRRRGTWGEVRSHRLMRPSRWQGYRVLQNRRPAGTTYPLCFLLSALSELLIVLMNILEESRNGGVRGGGAGLLFQGLWWLMIQSVGQDGWEWKAGSEKDYRAREEMGIGEGWGKRLICLIEISQLFPPFVRH